MKFSDLVDQANEQAPELSLLRPGRSNKTNVCYDCEETITSDRVAALPGVERCIHCQEELEKTPGAGRAKAL